MSQLGGTVHAGGLKNELQRGESKPGKTLTKKWI